MSTPPSTPHPVAHRQDLPGLRAGPAGLYARSAVAATATLALVLVLVLGPSANRSHAANLFGSLRAPGDAALIAGHRGDRGIAPENTIAALQHALDGPLVFVETDVRLSADGVPVLIHDETVDRTTDGHGAVADLTLAELKELDAGSWFAPAFAGNTIPTLDEFLGLLQGSNKRAILELKGSWAPEQVAAVADAVLAHRLQHRIVTSSFEPDTLTALQTAAPALPRMANLRSLPKDPVAYAQRYGAVALVTKPKAVEQNPGFVGDAHAAGIGVLLYTLNKERSWQSALSLGVDGIITDRPGVLDEWLAATAPGT